MNYRRLFIPNSIVFITVVTFDRKEFLIPNIELFKNAIKQTKEKYQFRDSTGAIIIEIDNDDWNGLTVTPADTVTIYGEVDKEIMHSPEIDVDRIEKK